MGKERENPRRRKKVPSIVTAGITASMLICAPSESSNAFPQETLNTQSRTVVQFGDSLTYGMHLLGNIDQLYEDKGVRAIIPGDSGGNSEGFCIAQTEGFPCHGLSGGISPDGLEVLDRNIKAVQSADVIVFEWGTNVTEKSTTEFKNAIDTAVTKTRTVNPDAKILWVNLASPQNKSVYEARNHAIEQEAREERFGIINWQGIGYKYLTKDVHPSPDGYKAMAQLIVDQASNL